MKSVGNWKTCLHRKGLTLVELLVGLMVSSIILAAVATLAYAMGAANESSDDIARKQAQLRHARLRISELLRHSRLVCGLVDSDLAVWRGDDNEDGLININELVLIQKGVSNDYLRLCEFGASETSSVTIADIGSLNPALYSADYVSLIPQCSNVEFLLDTAPPYSKFLSISFDLRENDVTRHYQLSSSVRSWAGHLLDQSGEIAGDDDEP